MFRSFKWLAPLFATIAFSISSLACAQTPEVIFISNYDELVLAANAAEKATDIGSVAISVEFYKNGMAFWAQERTRELIEQVFAFGDRAVYFYGVPFEKGVAEALLEMKAPDVCPSPIFLGKMILTKNPEEPVTLCGTNGDTSEEGLRQRILRLTAHMHHSMSK